MLTVTELLLPERGESLTLCLVEWQVLQIGVGGRSSREVPKGGGRGCRMSGLSRGRVMTEAV